MAAFETPSPPRRMSPVFFFFNDTATTEIYTLSLHDALPISPVGRRAPGHPAAFPGLDACTVGDRKSTRLNSSHLGISYAVFCLKKKTSRPYLRSKSHVTPNSRVRDRTRSTHASVTRAGRVLC